ncbi:hypothetical protein MHL31_03920 [Lutibacter sp. A80]|uniref:hypothetical protein n=1 Tax=Lutibacter sp. A80 TaxID=2918453 RepID=UPI001F050CA5|nr:hypothetical protein [Lutibacter sp. A80]UMB61356.1 hypothetical protein MHL31_03920 [Lutibacter sp. A80]
MAFSLSKLFKNKPKEVPSIPEIIEKIDFKGGTKYAKNETNIVYADVEELGGFPYLKTVIIGDTSVNIKRVGCTATFKFNNESIVLNSDNTTIESNKIKNTNVFFTEIDFELNEQEATKIKDQKVVTLEYGFKNKVTPFTPF